MTLPNCLGAVTRAEDGIFVLAVVKDVSPLGKFVASAQTRVLVIFLWWSCQEGRVWILGRLAGGHDFTEVC